MKKIRCQDLEIEGCAFTLFPICREMKIDIESSRAILWAMHICAKTIRKNGFVLKSNEKIIANNPVLPNVISTRNFKEEHLQFIDEAINEGLLITVANDKYQVTEKMLDVFEKAAKRHKHLQGRS